MPAKLERCVKQVMETSGISEESAWAICKSSIDSELILDTETINKARVDEITGFLTAPVILARTGVQYYYGMELGIEDRAMEKIGVFRPPEQVFSKKSVDLFVNLVVTDDHPPTPVTTDNVNGLQVGMVSGVKAQKDKGVLKGVLTITDKNVINKIKNGKIEVSVGYAHDLKEERGNYNGIEYDFVQTDIVPNHLAIVDAGRCGAACKITLDKKKEFTVEKVTIDGIEYEIDSAQLAQAIRKQQATHDAETEKLKKEKEKVLAEKEAMQKAKDKAEATADSLIADSKKFSDDAIAKLVTDKAILLMQAKEILGDKMPECIACDKEIKAAVIDHIDNKDVSGKSDEYIQAMYDMAIEKAAKAKESTDNLNKDFQSDNKTITRESAYKKYVADHFNGGR